MNNIIHILEVILASENILNLKTRKYHRNVESMKFKELHLHFEWLYTQSYEQIDEIAERIRILWSLTIGTYKEYLELSILDEDTEMTTDPKLMIPNLIADKQKLISYIKDSIATVDDIWTEDLLVSILTAHEKDVWMLKSMS